MLQATLYLKFLQDTIIETKYSTVYSLHYVTCAYHKTTFRSVVGSKEQLLGSSEIMLKINLGRAHIGHIKFILML